MKATCSRCRRPRPIGGHCRPCHNRRRREARRRTDPLTIAAVVETRRPTPGLRPRERHAIARQLTALRLSATEIARILSVTPRTVHRWRARDRETTDAA